MLSWRGHNYRSYSAIYFSMEWNFFRQMGSWGGHRKDFSTIMKSTGTMRTPLPLDPSKKKALLKGILDLNNKGTINPSSETRKGMRSVLHCFPGSKVIGRLPAGGRPEHTQYIYQDYQIQNGDSPENYSLNSSRSLPDYPRSDGCISPYSDYRLSPHVLEVYISGRALAVQSPSFQPEVCPKSCHKGVVSSGGSGYQSFHIRRLHAATKDQIQKFWEQIKKIDSYPVGICFTFFPNIS